MRMNVAIKYRTRLAAGRTKLRVWKIERSMSGCEADCSRTTNTASAAREKPAYPVQSAVLTGGFESSFKVRATPAISTMRSTMPGQSSREVTPPVSSSLR